jgi:diguanylate cyclase (GGDEF)-like protein
MADRNRANEEWILLKWLPVGAVLILLTGLLDLATGYEISFSLFYLGPIALLTWQLGRTVGLISSVFCAVVWFVADVQSGHVHSSSVVHIWNAGIRLGFFVIVTMLLSSLKVALDAEKKVARFDYLTGVANSRFFREALNAEIQRIARHRRPFTLAYIDLDNFKTVNDRFGHPEGDRALRAIAAEIARNVRNIDVVGRIGGDEFVLLLPESDGEGSRASIGRIQTNLLAEMERHGWPVTFSIGLVTCSTGSLTADALVKMADDLMYSVKTQGKNRIAHADAENLTPPSTQDHG